MGQGTEAPQFTLLATPLRRSFGSKYSAARPGGRDDIMSTTSKQLTNIDVDRLLRYKDIGHSATQLTRQPHPRDELS